MGQAGPPRAGSIACPVFFRCGGRDTLRRVLPVKRSALQTCGLCRSSSGELVAEPPLAAPRPTRSLSLSKGAQEARRSASSLYRDAPARSWLPGAAPRSTARRVGRNKHFAAFESSCASQPARSSRYTVRTRTPLDDRIGRWAPSNSPVSIILRARTSTKRRRASSIVWIAQAGRLAARQQAL